MAEVRLLLPPPSLKTEEVYWAKVFGHQREAVVAVEVVMEAEWIYQGLIHPYGPIYNSPL